MKEALLVKMDAAYAKLVLGKTEELYAWIKMKLS